MPDSEAATAAGPPAVNEPASARPLPEFWRGHIAGSNRGRIVIRLTRSGEGYRGAAVFHDNLFGITTFSLEGTRQGTQFQLQIRDFRSLSFGTSLSGQVAVNFDQELTKASGNWDTDIASGTLEIAAAETKGLRGLLATRTSWWWARLFAAAILHLPLIYSAGLLAILAIDVSKVFPSFNLSAPDLIIALLPAPLLLQRHVSRLLVLFGVESVSIGPLQLAAPRVPLTGDLFAALDRFFILQTKVLLIWLAAKDKVPVAEVCTYARTIGAAIFPTLGALVASGCAIIEAQNMSATPLGKSYVDHLVPRMSGAKS